MRNAKYEMRHIPLYTPNMNQSEPSTSLKSSAAIFPVEVLRNILWFLSSVDLWPLRLVDKLLYENVMELLVRRIEYAFAKGGLVLKVRNPQWHWCYFFLFHFFNKTCRDTQLYQKKKKKNITLIFSPCTVTRTNNRMQNNINTV